MIARSRKRGNSDETIIDTADRDDDQQRQHDAGTAATSTSARRRRRAGRRAPTTRFSPRLNRLVSTTASGITSRGNCVLRTTPSCATIDVTAVAGRLLEEAEQHDVEQQQHRIVRHLRAEPEHLREHREQDAEQHQRPRDRPQVAERGAEVVLLEVGRPRSGRAARARAASRRPARTGPARRAAAPARRSRAAPRAPARRRPARVTRPCSGAVPKTRKFTSRRPCTVSGPCSLLLADVARRASRCPGTSRFSIEPSSRTRRPAATSASSRRVELEHRLAVGVADVEDELRPLAAAARPRATTSSRSGSPSSTFSTALPARVEQRGAHHARVDVDDLVARPARRRSPAKFIR